MKCQRKWIFLQVTLMSVFVLYLTTVFLKMKHVMGSFPEIMKPKNQQDLHRIIQIRTIEKRLNPFSGRVEINMTEVIKTIQDLQNHPWEFNITKLKVHSSELRQKCNATREMILSQENTRKGQKITYEVERKSVKSVDDSLFQMLPKTFPWSSYLGHCALVGNGGILKGSRCGKQIDKADFVFRMNMPPMTNTTDVGSKTSMLTLNPSIMKKFASLNYARRPFAEQMKQYSGAFVLMPAFSYSQCTVPSFKVYYTLQEFNFQEVFFLHPDYLLRLSNYWKQKGLKFFRLSSGMMLVSAALELCESITLYGFWPYSFDLSEQPLSHHYYDNVQPKGNVHDMPTEFWIYTRMHLEGVLKLHLGNC
ncbi:alpha-2,8-sialyltransferase 8F-like isoform X1 [Erpetoichthys calabaricus]|nr:alpha-2,8-sialyltransferase 8F-like isoform X1 [Erpetoichthys calabaricus]